jgi:hypothetical protein
MSTKKLFSKKPLFSAALVLGLAGLLLSSCIGSGQQASMDALFSATPTFTPIATIDWFPVTATPAPQIKTTSTPNPAANPNFSNVIFSDAGVMKDHWSSAITTEGNVTVNQDSIALAVNSPAALLSTFRNDTSLGNYYFESVMTADLCKNSDQMGVLFRAQDSLDYYRLLIDCEGKIALQQVLGGTPIALKDWSFSNQIQAGLSAPIKIGIWVKSSTLRIYLNDQLQWEAESSAFFDGSIGFFAKASGDTSVTVHFSDITVYEVKP